MAKISYSEKLKDPRWQKKRLKILERDNWMCKYCGDSETTLHVHHLAYNGNPWNTPDNDLISCCVHCHDIIELIKGQFPEMKIEQIIKHKHPQNGDYVIFMRMRDSISPSIARVEFSNGDYAGGSVLFKTHIESIIKLFKGF